MTFAPLCRRYARPAAVGLWLSLGLAAGGFAQDASAPTAPTAPQAPGGGAVVIEQDVSGHYFEWGLTAIGAGAALFVVCRSSRRN